MMEDDGVEVLDIELVIDPVEEVEVEEVVEDHPSIAWGVVDLLRSRCVYFTKRLRFIKVPGHEGDSPGHCRVLKLLRRWTENPKNIALLLWLIAVGVSSSMLGLILMGLLDDAFPTKASRNRWIEINNQVLNALFTLMSLYQHPKLFHHLALLWRWSPDDASELRSIYSKHHRQLSPLSRERSHMTAVVLLLHATCFAQYALCGLYWGYSLARRREGAENLFLCIGVVAPVSAGFYTTFSPLGRQPAIELDQEMQILRCDQRKGLEIPREWAGGLFDCWNSEEDDALRMLSSCLCTCCVFGWNAERLGLGNRYVHMVTFVLLCVAPFWIFNISALNIHDEVIADMVGVAGVVLCAFGLLYGGFWRIQVRRRLGIPGSVVGDYVLWMFCWPCALAQEVRTGNDHAKRVAGEVSDDEEEREGFMKEDSKEEEVAAMGVMAPPQKVEMDSDGGRPT